MKKALLMLCCLLTFACSKHSDEKTITVAASSVPHAQMLEFVRPELESQGYKLKILQIDDYTIPNRALNEKEVDANFFQHTPFLDEQVKGFGYKIKCYARIHLEPMAIYSDKVKDLKDLKQGATVAVPSDPTNEYRALKIFENEGLIKLRPGVSLSATVADIQENPKNLKFKEIEAALLPRTIKDVDAAAIPTNYALQERLNPVRDALAIEEDDSPYVNIIAIRDGDGAMPKLQALKNAMLAPNMRTFINDTYKGAIIPVLKECSEK